GVDGVPSRERLPTPNCYVHKARFDFHRIAAPTNALGGQHRGPGARKCVEHDVIAACAVLDRIGDHRDGFGGRMAFEVSQPLNAKAVGTWIMPNIRSRPAVTTKLNIVEMSLRADAKDADQFMLATVEAALARVALDPRNQIEHVAIHELAGFDKLAHMP